jgi:phosphoglycolate phosphatase
MARFNPQLIIFDLDGTLVDSLPDLCNAVNAALADFGQAAVSLQQVRDWVGNGAPKLVERALRHRGVDVAQLPAYYERYAFHYDRLMDSDSKPYPGVMTTLGQLRGWGMPMAVCTNKAGRFVGTMLDRLGMSPFFSATLAGDDLPECKPSPMPLLHLAARFKLEPRQALMVGDSINDVASARAAGMPVVALSYGYNHGGRIEDTHPDVLLDRFDGLLDLLRPAGHT